jgi:hypothetical protein
VQPPGGRPRCLLEPLRRPTARPRCNGPSSGPQRRPLRSPRRRPDSLEGRLRPRQHRAAPDPPCWPRPRPWPGRFRDPRGQAAGGTPRSRVQPLGTGALRHREAAQPDFVSPPGGGGSYSGRNFLERRHRSGRDVLWLWSRRSAVRRGTAAGLEAGRRCEREAAGEAKRRGRYPKRDTNGRSAPDKRHQAPGQAASGAGAHAARERPSRLLRAAHPPPARPRTSAQRPRKCGGRGGLQSAVMTGRETCFDSP